MNLPFEGPVITAMSGRGIWYMSGIVGCGWVRDMTLLEYLPGHTCTLNVF